MNGKHIIRASLVAIGLMLIGCDRPKTASALPEPAKPAVQVASTPVDSAPAAVPVVASVKPPATQPAAKVLYLQIFERMTADDRGILYPFPRARLHINASEKTAVLYTDDPKTAINPGYAGNSFYLVIPLDENHPLHLDNYQWDNKAPTGGERQESTDGIFLEGQRYHLQPGDIHVAFQGEGPTLLFSIWGDFVKFDSKAGASKLGQDVRILASGHPVTVDEAK